LSMQNFAWPDPKMPWQLQDLLKHITLVLALALAALGIPIFGFRLLAPYLPKGLQVISRTTLKEMRIENEESLNLKIGQGGKTKTGLRPTGKAIFGDKTYEVTARSHFIEANTDIEVVEISGNKILVKDINA
jgi:membrane-bound ClpP family serine protease